MIVSGQGLRRCAVLSLAMAATGSAWGAGHQNGTAGKQLPAAVGDSLARGMPQNVIVLLEDDDIEREAGRRRALSGIEADDEALLSFKAGRYRDLKQRTDALLPSGDGETVQEYRHLPMAVKRFRSRKALETFIAGPTVKAVYEDRPILPHLAYSLPFIGQNSVAGGGLTGTGQTVAVIDSGIDYTLPAFGSCSAPGSPAGCRVVAAVDTSGAPNLVTTANNHGTNVSAIVTGTAPGTRVASFNALPGGAGSTSTVIAGIDWAIANRSAYNITVLNMSLGDTGNYTSPCGNSALNPFVAPVNNARAAGILPVASSGNSGFTGGMASPACTPGVVSVGAVYDANWGGPYTWSSGCTDASSGPDRIPCFSNSASFLTILAPGAFITAAGIQMAGTSQASPHVAGAAAVLRAAYPADTLDQSVGRLTSGGASVTDPRNSIAKPRLNLQAAIGAPANDLFANRPLLSGDSGRIQAHNLNATKETGEPNHAGTPGGRSVWWRWIPSVSGLASFDTHDSSFDTLLAVYSGTTLPCLTTVAANDNNGSAANTSGVTFTALAGNEYLIAVDGFNGANGSITLNWGLVQATDVPAVPALSAWGLLGGMVTLMGVVMKRKGKGSA